MKDPRQVAPARVGHSLAGKMAIWSGAFAWMLTPVVAYLLARHRAESRDALPHAVALSLIKALGGTTSIFMLVTLVLGMVGVFQGKRKRTSALTALVMFLAWIGLSAVLSKGFTH